MSILDLTMWAIIIASFISWPACVRYNKLIKDESDYILLVTLWLCSPMFMWGILLVWLIRLIFGKVKGE